jgi:hypothetical protein
MKKKADVSRRNVPNVQGKRLLKRWKIKRTDFSPFPGGPVVMEGEFIIG